VAAVTGKGVRRPLLFFCGISQSRLLSGSSQEAGDQLIGELSEAKMDLMLQSRKTSGILGKFVGPELLLLLQLRVDALKRLLGRWDGRAGRAAKTEEH
jgi:hypothetical protein